MPRKALIVDDEPDTGHLLSENLRRWGFETVVLDEGDRVTAWVHEHQPDLVLLDLMLPGKDGYDICQDLKLDRRTNLVPIIMVTVLDKPQDRVRGLQVG